MPTDRCRTRVEAGIVELFALGDDRVFDLDRGAVRESFRCTRAHLDALPAAMTPPQVIEEPRADLVLRAELDHVEPLHVEIDDQTTKTHGDIPSGHDPASWPGAQL